MKIAVIGATGYSGIELIRLLLQHPHAEITHLVTTSQEGENIAAIYPHLRGVLEQELTAFQAETIAEQADVVFFATPAGVSKKWAPFFLQYDVICIDLSGDFRLKDPGLYETWYGAEAADQSYLEQAVYGLSELNAQRIKEANLIANPGCYPTAALLGLIPLLQMDIVDPQSIIVDAKSGVSGAGRKLSLATHFAQVNENVIPYKLGKHQHVPEIEQELASFVSEGEQGELNISFTTHLMPMTRGILNTMYASLREDLDTGELIARYEQFYRGHPFIRIYPEGTCPATKNVYGTNFCDIGLFVDQRTRRVTVLSAIDNVVKGAAGQALQNLNIRCGWEQTSGLKQTPVFP